ncbi:MAG: ABC transporter permease [Candidatus Kapabacteria bacterium]|nr:ABC transporter permease [Candidatus Kapabacteria bacterium]
MKRIVLVEIAATMLRARLRQTIVAAVGVTFGVAMFVTLLGFMNGLNNMLDGLITNRTPHVRLFNEVEPNPVQPLSKVNEFRGAYNFISSLKPVSGRKEIYGVNKILKTLDADADVLGYSPKITTPVIISDGPVELTAVVYGIDVDAELRLFLFADYVVAGNPRDLNTVSNSVILGKPLAEKLYVKIGDVVQVATAQGDRFPLKVVGLYQSGLADIDRTLCYASLSTAQKILGQSAGYITDVNIKMHDINIAPKKSVWYRALFGTSAEDIQTSNAQFETGSSIRTLISYAVGITLLVVAGFGIYNILNMMIYEKMDAIAILKATGFSGNDVKWIFIIISLSIGIVGCLGGLISGFLLSSIIDNLPFKTAALPTITTFPVSYNVAFYLIAMAFSIVTTFVAGWLPARKASKIDPVLIIRGH